MESAGARKPDGERHSTRHTYDVRSSPSGHGCELPAHDRHGLARDVLAMTRDVGTGSTPSSRALRDALNCTG